MDEGFATFAQRYHLGGEACSTRTAQRGSEMVSALHKQFAEDWLLCLYRDALSVETPHSQDCYQCAC